MTTRLFDSHGVTLRVAGIPLRLCRAGPVLLDALAGQFTEQLERYALVDLADRPGGVRPLHGVTRIPLLTIASVVERCSAVLTAAGATGHQISAPQVAHFAGTPTVGDGWDIPITDPDHPTRIITVLTGRNLTVVTATLDDMTPAGEAASQLRAVIAIGERPLPTAAAAMAALRIGLSALRSLSHVSGMEAIFVNASGEASWTDGLRELRS